MDQRVSTGGRDRHPGYLQPANGTVHNFSPGESGVLGGERINYNCSDRTQILGLPDLGGRVWWVHQAVVASDLESFDYSKWVPVATAWY